MAIGPEHALQVMVSKWVRTCVVQPHFFTGIDRAKRSARFSHVREKARGLVSGFPDTILMVRWQPIICVELKAPGKKPTDNQFAVGSAILAAGGFWHWATSVRQYCEILQSRQVALHPHAEMLAQGHDATLAGAAIRRDEARTGKPSAKRFAPPKPSTARVMRAEKLRAVVRY